MKYFVILFIIFILTGCRGESVVFERSQEVVEKNQSRGGQEADKAEGARGQKGEEQYEDREWKMENGVGDGGLALDDGGDIRGGAESEFRTNDDDVIIPEEFDSPVKFSPQAPFAIWDELHQEACEEAAMIMAVKYLKNEDLDKQIMENEIQELVAWETENGYAIDVTTAETAQILKDYFELEAEVTDEVSVERIKRELALGNLVITPHAGRQLGNPYYRQPGPLYHFLVIRGWDSDEFITNDPGTKRGEGYKYKFDTLINTVHDWNQGNVEGGERVMVVVRQ